MQPHHVSEESTALQTRTEKLYSLSTATVSELFEKYPTLDQAKDFSSLSYNSNNNRFSFSKSVCIASHDGMNLFIGYTKVVVQFQAKIELPRSVLQKEMAAESLVLLQNKFFGFFEPVYQSPACNDPSRKCDEWLCTKNVAENGTTRSSDHEAHIDAKIFQTPHDNYSEANWSHRKTRAAISTTRILDPAYLIRQNLEQEKNVMFQALSNLFSTIKRRPRLALIKTFLEKVQL